jgi:transcriptional antiterminator
MGAKISEKMISKIQKLIEDIHAGNTGNPKEISIKLGVSERMVYKYIELIKIEFKAPVKYNRILQTYYFESDGHLDLRWIKE